MTVAAIVPAAGRGDRLGPGQPKALRTLGGVPMLVHAVRALSRARLVDLVVVAAPPDGVGDVKALLALHDIGAEVLVVAGGAERQDSVARALEALPPAVDVVLVHDAARPLAPSELVDAVAGAVLAGHIAVVPGVPMADTVKRIAPGEPRDGGERGPRSELVSETVSRSDLRCIQTPQGFDRAVLAKAHAMADATLTDDAGLVERLGLPVVVVEGSAEAFKITRPIDLLLAEAVLLERRANGAL
ncbi:MAG: 2-C-methyl-D-erythritol 4-phosphate cytidylyltransferase [Actinomycetota bacterium]|nr:2-C-methyl-D-erythritol 4-phosphate cytidylyltransferase [Actinomycetota bacterium]